MKRVIMAKTDKGSTYGKFFNALYETLHEMDNAVTNLYYDEDERGEYVYITYANNEYKVNVTASSRIGIWLDVTNQFVYKYL